MKKIQADLFNLNGVVILEKNDKSINGIKNTIKRLVKQKVTKMEL